MGEAGKKVLRSKEEQGKAGCKLKMFETSILAGSTKKLGKERRGPDSHWESPYEGGGKWCKEGERGNYKIRFDRVEASGPNNTTERKGPRVNERTKKSYRGKKAK